MKKILLAATAAICAGGVASAQGVELSGEAKLGLLYVKDAPQEWDTISWARVKFSLSNTSDNDLVGEFGGSFSLDANEVVTGLTDTTTGVTVGALSNQVAVYVGSAAGPIGKIEAGNNLSAADKMSGGLNDIGLGVLWTNGLGVDDVAEAYYGGSGNTLRYEKEVAGAGIAVSANLDDSWAIGGEYAISEQFTIGAGYDRNEEARTTSGVNDLNTLSFGAIAKLDQIEGRFIYSNRETSVPMGQQAIADKSAYGIEVAYTLGATKFTAMYGQNDGDLAAAIDDVDAWGIGVNHDLGGGLAFKGGFGKIDELTLADLGFYMEF